MTYQRTPPVRCFFTMRTMETEVLIIGGGCAGLWIAHELARSGRAPLLLEYGPLAQFASQRNQGWLHSGSLYAMIEATPDRTGELLQLARTCFVASQRLKRFAKRHAPRAFNLRANCYYLFSEFQQAQAPIERLKEIGLDPRVFREGELEHIEPILKDSPARVAVEAPDIPMNCGALLQSVCHRALEFGTQVMQTTIPLREWDLHRTDDRWSLRSNEAEISTKIVISAVGPLISQFPYRERLFPEALPTLQKGAVAILNQRICQSILVFRDRASDYLNLTPFPNLTTVNLGARDREIEACTEGPVDGTEIESIADRLSEFCPSLACSPVGIPSAFYFCHKVANNVAGSHPLNRRASRHYFWRSDPLAKGLYYIYAGKFTLGLSSAQSLVRAIRDSLSSGPARPITRPRYRPELLVAPSPYHSLQTHYLRREQPGALRFVSRLM